VEDVGG